MAVELKKVINKKINQLDNIQYHAYAQYNKRTQIAKKNMI